MGLTKTTAAISSSNSFAFLKESTIECLNQYTENSDNKIILDKYKKVKKNILETSSEDMSKENLQRYLTIAKLKEEILGEK